MATDTAGDPVSGVKWTRRTTEKVADELRSAGIDVSPTTVGKLLKDLGYRLVLLVACEKVRMPRLAAMARRPASSARYADTGAIGTRSASSSS